MGPRAHKGPWGLCSQVVLQKYRKGQAIGDPVEEAFEIRRLQIQWILGLQNLESGPQEATLNEQV